MPRATEALPRQTLTLLLMVAFSTMLQVAQGSNDPNSSLKASKLATELLTSAHEPAGVDRRRFDNATRKLGPAVFLISILPGGDDGLEAEPKGSAFLISRKHQLLATAAHVADRAVDGGTLVAFPNGTETQYRIDRIWYHPGVVREFDVGLYAPSTDPRDGKIRLPTIDVAILRLAEGGAPLPDECELATDEELRGLDHEAVGQLGFLEEEAEENPSARKGEVATLGTGRITKHIDYTKYFLGDDSTPSEKRQWLGTTPLLGHGSSGGPLFLENGRVIALCSCGSQSTKGVPHDEFIRIDLVRQALSQNGLLGHSGREFDRESAQGCASLDARLERFRRAVQLVREAGELRLSGRYHEAGENCNKALQLVPEYGMAYFRRAEVYIHYCAAFWGKLSAEQKRRFTLLASEDVNHGNQVLRYWHPVPDLFQAYINLYNDLAFPETADVLRNIAFLVNLIDNPIHPLEDSEKARLIICRAHCRVAIRDFDGAQRDFDEAVRLAPDEPQGYRNRAFFWERRNRLDLAASDRKAAEQLLQAIVSDSSKTAQ